VVALSESLRTSFAQMGAKIGVSVLCPGIVNTRIADSERNRPAEFCGPDYEPCFERIIKNHPELEQLVRGAPKLWEKGTSPDQSGDVVFEAIKKDIFYIFTETGLMWKRAMKARFDGIWEDYKQIKPILKDL
ncbi:unnamed protein product, partial [marine sediment metagenome]